jgi:hypothetical protein
MTGVEVLGSFFWRKWTAANLAGASLLPKAASASNNHGSALTQPRRGRLQADEAAAGLPIAARQTCGTRNWPPLSLALRSLQRSQRSQRSADACSSLGCSGRRLAPALKRLVDCSFFQVVVQTTAAGACALAFRRAKQANGLSWPFLVRDCGNIYKLGNRSRAFLRTLHV